MRRSIFGRVSQTPEHPAVNIELKIPHHTSPAQGVVFSQYAETLLDAGVFEKRIDQERENHKNKIDYFSGNAFFGA